MGGIRSARLRCSRRGAAEYARTRLEELERRWSRFLPDSDVTRLNSTTGAIMCVSSDTMRLLAAMKEAWRVTRGRYGPTLLVAVVAAGYATSIDGSGRRSLCVGRPSLGRTIADVTIDPVTAAVTVPRGLGLDPGGLGKGLAADLVVTELLEQGTAGALVGFGGDLAAAGTPPTAAGWYVAVEQPRDRSRTLATLAFGAGGVATSSTLTRAWAADGERRHHVIDPASGRCASTDLASVTVVARAGWEAEAHATAALLCGSEWVLDYLARQRLEGLAVTLSGSILTSPALGAAGISERSVA